MREPSITEDEASRRVETGEWSYQSTLRSDVQSEIMEILHSWTQNFQLTAEQRRVIVMASVYEASSGQVLSELAESRESATIRDDPYHRYLPILSIWEKPRVIKFSRTFERTKLSLRSEE